MIELHTKKNGFCGLESAKAELKIENGSMQREAFIQFLKCEGDSFKTKDLIKYLASPLGEDTNNEHYNLPEEIKLASFVENIVG